MKISGKVALVLFGVALTVGGFELGERLSVPGVQGIVSTAEAKVGRPLTPVSVAGVSRRTSRRD
ncbi:MAG: hypothetical protein GY788_27545 [bacterium]|nr:hypothetical protein [bacterium]